MEDVVLAAWLLGVSWVARALFGDAPLDSAGPAGVPPVAWVAGALLAFLLVTRGADDTDLDTAVKQRVLIAGPGYPLLSLFGPMGVHDRALRLLPRADDDAAWR